MIKLVLLPTQNLLFAQLLLAVLPMISDILLRASAQNDACIMHGNSVCSSLCQHLLLTSSN